MSEPVTPEEKAIRRGEKAIEAIEAEMVVTHFQLWKWELEYAARSDHPMMTRSRIGTDGAGGQADPQAPRGERRSLRADDGWPLRPDRVPRLKPYPEATDLGRAVTGGAAICRIVETAHSVTVVATRTLSIASSPVTSAAIPVTSAASPSSEAIAR